MNSSTRIKICFVAPKAYINKLEKIIEHLKQKGFQSKRLQDLYYEKLRQIP